MANKTIVAYRPNGVDSCRNCVMGQTDSNFDIFTSDDHRDIIHFWLNKLQDKWHNKDNRAYTSWEMHIVDTDGEVWEVSRYTDPTWMEQPFKGWYEEVQGLFNKWKAVKEGHLITAKKNAEELAKSKAEAFEKAQLAELLAKYPQGGQ